jgi:FixJ family two-component response regulator
MIAQASRGCVAVVDDDDEVLSAVGSLLRAAGFSVRLHDTTEAFLAAGVPDVASCLVLDVRLREANGIEFQEWMAENGIAIPVVLITGYADIPMTVRGMRAGAVDILPKPFDDETLIAAITSAIETDRKRREGDADGIVLRGLYKHLTPREREAMSLVVAGLMNKQVAARMDLSEITVKIHRGNVMRKMGAQSLADLVRMAELLGVRDETIHRYNISV